MHAHQANQAHVNIGVLVQTSTPRGQRVRALWCAWMCYCRRVAGAHAPAVCAHEAVAPGCHCRHSTGAVQLSIVYFDVLPTFAVQKARVARILSAAIIP